MRNDVQFKRKWAAPSRISSSSRRLLCVCECVRSVYKSIRTHPQMIMVIWRIFSRFIRPIIWCVECFCWNLMIWFMVNWMDSMLFVRTLDSMSMRNSRCYETEPTVQHFVSLSLSLSVSVSLFFLSFWLPFLWPQTESQAKYKWQIKLFVWIYGMDMWASARVLCVDGRRVH